MRGGRVVVSCKSYSSIPESRLLRQAKKKTFPYAAFMSPLINACSLLAKFLIRAHYRVYVRLKKKFQVFLLCRRLLMPVV